MSLEVAVPTPIPGLHEEIPLTLSSASRYSCPAVSERSSFATCADWGVSVEDGIVWTKTVASISVEASTTSVTASSIVLGSSSIVDTTLLPSVEPDMSLLPGVNGREKDVLLGVIGRSAGRDHERRIGNGGSGFHLLVRSLKQGTGGGGGGGVDKSKVERARLGERKVLMMLARRRGLDGEGVSSRKAGWMLVSGGGERKGSKSGEIGVAIANDGVLLLLSIGSNR